MKLIIRTSAELHIKEAVNWYSEKAPFQVKRFVTDLSRIFELIQDKPELFQLRYKGIRIAFLTNFPYGVHYIIDDGQVIIIAVLHTKRYFNK